MAANDKPIHFKRPGEGAPTQCAVSGLPLKGPYLIRHISSGKGEPEFVYAVLARHRPTDFAELDAKVRAAASEQNRLAKKAASAVPAPEPEKK